MKAVLTQVRISPKKANVVAGMVRNMPARDALTTLKFMNKKGADIIYKLLASAIANAENNFSQKADDLVLSTILVTEGPTYKRGQSRSKGRVFSLLKRTANIRIELSATVVEDSKEEKVNSKK